MAASKRVKEEMNYQLTENMKEYRNETEQLLFRLPLAGSVFKKVYYDPLKKRPSSCMVPAEDFIVDYGCSDLENSERYTHVMRKSPNQVKKLQRAGFYRKLKLEKPAAEPPPEGKEKEDEITGIEPTQRSTNRRHVIYEIHAYYNLPGVLSDPDDVADPYIITIEKQSAQGVCRSTATGTRPTSMRVAEQYFVHFQYMPGLGFYGIGLIHLLGSIAKAATSILRQLIDAGTLSNLPGGLKTRGLRTKGDDTPIAPGEWRDVDVPAGTIQQNLFPMPYKEPSAVLAGLLQMLVEEGRRVGSIADTEITAQTMNAPVGTTLALLERSMKVMTAVHARLHASLRREFGLIAKSIFDYMDEKYDWDESGQFNRRQDFDGKTVDVMPVSDPNASTQAHRIIQAQAVQQLAAMNPELYNMKELHRAGLAGHRRQERREDPAAWTSRRRCMDPVQENMAMLTSQPVKVYPDQDHTAHIQVHLSLVTDPEDSGNAEGVAVTPPRCRARWKPIWPSIWRISTGGEIEQMMGVQLPPLGEQQPPEVEGMLSRALADASVRLANCTTRRPSRSRPSRSPPIRCSSFASARWRSRRRRRNTRRRRTPSTAFSRLPRMPRTRRSNTPSIASQEKQTGAKIGADLVTFGQELEHKERLEGIELGKDITESIATKVQESQKMGQEQADHQTRPRSRG